MFFVFSQTSDAVFRFARIQEPGDWFWPILATLVFLYWAKRRYAIDAADLGKGARFPLLFLRFGVIVSLLIFYLHPQWERIVGSSRVALLIDCSASMSTRDLEEEEKRKMQFFGAPQKPETPDPGEKESENSGNHRSQVKVLELSGSPSRLDSLTDWFTRSGIVEKLREKHDVAIYRFDHSLDRLSVVETKKDAEQSPRNRDWIFELKADGNETRLGDALRDLLQRERGQPLSGVLLFTDGGWNAGDSLESATQQAAGSRIPVYAFGFGMNRQPLNFRILHVDAPERAFPNDPFKFKAQIEMQGGEIAEGISGEKERITLPVELRIAPENSSTEEVPTPMDSVGELLARREIELSSGTIREVEFEVNPREVGKYSLLFRILPPEEDGIAEDDFQNATVEIVDRKDRILLFAGGPMRDYQFLCNQLNRDRSVEVDAYLPWAGAGISQSVDRVLDSFPSDRLEMSQYDCVVAFDPNWRILSSEQVVILEHWVARQGGGLIVVAGPVNLADTITGWTSDPGMDKIRALYPVDVSSMRTSSVLSYRTDSQPWALNWSRAGEEAEFLRPADTDLESRAIWGEFTGFFSFFVVNALKPTATLYAKSSSPDTASTSGVAPIFAEHFYGSGRVFYIGNAEIWRLRMLNDSYFEKIYTKLIRHVAEGRLHQRSQWGSLATDKKRYTLGSTAAIRATAFDMQFNPLELPTLELDLITPDAKIRRISLQIDPNVPGSYSGFVPLITEGTWNFRMQIPETNEILTESVQVRMSDLEKENPSRNEPLLKELAEKTQGEYFSSPYEAALEVEAKEGISLLDKLTVRSQRSVLDAGADEKSMKYFLCIFCVLLCTEWLLRRLLRLA